MNERLLHLAGLKGIARSYNDIWGQPQATSDHAAGALLAAMGVLAAGDAAPAAIEAAISAHEANERSELLPPVLVLYDDAPSWQLPASVAAAGAALNWRITTEDGALLEGVVAAELPASQRPPQGYHQLTLLRGSQALAACSLIVAPRTTYRPAALQGQAKLWGAAAQLYAVRSARNWGIGDYGDLLRLVELWGQAGAGVVGVNPLHAMFPHNPDHSSPYSPSSRLFLNLIYLDVEAIPDYAECARAQARVASPALRARLAALRAAELVNYAGVAEAKRPVLELLYTHFREQHLATDSARARAFEDFRRRRGSELRRHALFEALQAYFHRADDQVWGWPVWPAAYRDPASPAVAAFEREKAVAVEFFEYLQWQADEQLAAVGRRARELGMGVGLYVDLAVSIDRAGAEAWSEQSLYALDASVGAPPDEYNPKGQNWGLPPLDPARLRAAGYAPFIATLRANMAHAGALRIDHVMTLMRLYWIAPGGEPDDGAYVHYPFDDMLAILALESQRNQCLVIGEDLGTVADEVRVKLAAAGVLSYRVLFFERDGSGDFKPPASYPPQSIAVASTHDLATLAGWWQGHDLALRARLNLFPSPELRDQQIAERAQDRQRLLAALQREQLLPPGVSSDAQALPALDAACMRALHLYLARSPSQLVVAQLEDMLLALDAVNLPGTTDPQPNWRRKLTLALEDWAGDERFTALTRELARERTRPAGAPAAPAQ
ncbi:MAG: 4-alpha-glucanotransferase [Rubrivivax sp.]|nr:4-alpha-glucanotransferase [Rubrivivax sp.]